MLDRTQPSCSASSESSSGSSASARNMSTPALASERPSGRTAASSRASTASAVPRREKTKPAAAAGRRAALRGGFFTSEAYDPLPGGSSTTGRGKIGRGACRGRGEISGGARSLKKKKKKYR